MSRQLWLPPLELDAGGVGIGAMMYARIRVPEKEKNRINLSGMELVREGRGLLIAKRHNAFVNLGLHFVLDRLFNINTPNAAIAYMGITADVNAVTAGTTAIDPAPTTSQNIKALGAGVGAVATSRTGETTTCSAGWTKSDANFPVAKVGLFNTSTDAADDTVPTVQGVMNIIGGTGGSSPYNEPFTIDLTGTSAFNLTLAMDVTATAS